eukprot:2760268-Lingulodinium_polyedra.AAC.1
MIPAFPVRALLVACGWMSAKSRWLAVTNKGLFAKSGKSAIRYSPFHLSPGANDSPGIYRTA